MFRHHLLLFLRSSLRSKSTFFINLISLSTGLTCVLLIYLWVSDELSFDKFHERNGQLFQVMKNASYSGKEITTYEATPGRLAEALANEMPEVEKAVTLNPWSNSIVSAGDKQIKVADLYAEKDFFAIFSYPLLEGDKNDVLNDKHGVVISEELAKKLFTSFQNVVGKFIERKQGDHVEVFYIAGIYQKPPANSTYQFDIVLPFDVLRAKSPELDEWFNGGGITCVMLKKGTNIDGFNNKINAFLQKKSGDSLIGELFTRPYSDKYLYDKFQNGVQVGGRIEYVRLFSTIAVFILLIACVNFTNLFTAKISARLKELGVKKALGASRKTLICQYLSESTLIAFLSFLLASLLVLLLLPQFNHITGKQLALHFDTSAIFSYLAIIFITGFIAGSYPALYISSFKAVSVLKGKLTASLRDGLARKGLVIFQFAISIIFIVFVLVVFKQVQLIQTKNLGYNRDNIIKFKKEGKLQDNFGNFLQEVRNLPGVVNVSNSGGNLTSADNTTDALEWKGKSPGERMTFASLHVGYEFIETLDIKLKEGRTFSRGYGSDSSKIILTEGAVSVMNLKDPLGKTVKLDGREVQIIGVVKNFHFESLHKQIKPAFFLLRPSAENIMVKIKAGAERATLKEIENIYQEFNKGLPFEYTFLDDDFQALYASEQRVAILSQYFSIIAIIISCLGLFGLAAFTADRRRKEIGVRKVLGATISQIVLLLTKDFISLVLLAILIGFPVAIWATNTWMQDFAYKAEIELWIYALAAVAAIFIALVTVSFQAIKAAIANPVKSLRTE